MNQVNHTSAAAMESNHGSTTIDGLTTVHPNSSANGVDFSGSGQELRCSSSSTFSSSPDSPLADPFLDCEYDMTEHIQSSSGHGQTNVSQSSLSKNELSTKEFPTTIGATELSLPDTSTDSPPIQVMERSMDSPYRIPPDVFTRTKSTDPVDWSMASNESLFSIHTGSMSFSKDPMFWQSEELGLPGKPTTPTQMFDVPPLDRHLVSTTTDSCQSSGQDKAAAGTINKVDGISEKLSLGPAISRCSDASSASVKSFAFPILTNDTTVSPKKSDASARISPENLQPQTPKEQQLVEQETKAKNSCLPAFSCTKWLRSFPCCC